MHPIKVVTSGVSVRVGVGGRKHRKRRRALLRARFRMHGTMMAVAPDGRKFTVRLECWTAWCAVAA